MAPKPAVVVARVVGPLEMGVGEGAGWSGMGTSVALSKVEMLPSSGVSKEGTNTSSMIWTTAFFWFSGGGGGKGAGRHGKGRGSGGHGSSHSYSQADGSRLTADWSRLSKLVPLWLLPMVLVPWYHVCVCFTVPVP